MVKITKEVKETKERMSQYFTFMMKDNDSDIIYTAMLIDDTTIVNSRYLVFWVSKNGVLFSVVKSKEDIQEKVNCGLYEVVDILDDITDKEVFKDTSILLKEEKVEPKEFDSKYFTFKYNKDRSVLYTAVELSHEDKVLIFWKKSLDGEIRALTYPLRRVEKNMNDGTWVLVDILDGENND